MIEQVADLGLFVSFPNENSEGPSKAQLKKLAKEQYQKDQKALKAAGLPPTEEAKDPNAKVVKFEKPTKEESKAEPAAATQEAPKKKQKQVQKP